MPERANTDRYAKPERMAQRLERVLHQAVPDHAGQRFQARFLVLGVEHQITAVAEPGDLQVAQQRSSAPG